MRLYAKISFRNMKMFPIVIMSRFPCHLERAKRGESSDKSLGNQNVVEYQLTFYKITGYFLYVSYINLQKRN